MGSICERLSGAWLRMLALLLICLFGVNQLPGQCADSAFPIRPVTFDVAGMGLVQHWEFSSPEGGTLVKAAVDRAYWVGDDAVLLWGHRPIGADGKRLDARLGLFLLQRSERFGMAAWQCTYESGLHSDSLGEYRALVPIAVLEKGAYRLLLVDVQDETSIGLVLVLFREGKLVAERHLGLTTRDWETGNSVGPCATMDSAGAVHFAADQIYDLWSQTKGNAVYAGQSLSWTVSDGLVAAPVQYMPSVQRGMFYRVTPRGYVALGDGSRIPKGKQLTAFAAEIMGKPVSEINHEKPF